MIMVWARFLSTAFVLPALSVSVSPFLPLSVSPLRSNRPWRAKRFCFPSFFFRRASRGSFPTLIPFLYISSSFFSLA